MKTKVLHPRSSVRFIICKKKGMAIGSTWDKVDAKGINFMAMDETQISDSFIYISNLPNTHHSLSST
jgi:hypothetical protein